MRKIQDLVEQMEEEIEGAKCYAETYLDMKSRSTTDKTEIAGKYAPKYKAMAEDELKHCMIIHDRAVEEIGVLSKVYTPPADMEKKWEEAHKAYVEKAAWIKQMLAM